MEYFIIFICSQTRKYQKVSENIRKHQKKTENTNYNQAKSSFKEKVDERLIPAEDPLHSISHAGTRTPIATGSSISGTRARASARKAKVQVVANSLKRLQVLQQEELKLERKKEQFKLENELAKAQAEERALAEAEGISIHDSSSLKSASRVSAWVERVRKNNNDLSNVPENIQSTSLNRNINPEAKEWGNNN